MCLYTKSKKPEISNEDIKVYKIVKIVNGKYYTPFMDKPLMETPEETVESDPSNFKRMTILNPFTLSPAETLYQITKGAIHAYTKKVVATNVLSEHSVCFDTHEIIEGTIPAGAEYWEGTNFDICARNIKFDKKYLK